MEIEKKRGREGENKRRKMWRYMMLSDQLTSSTKIITQSK